MVLAALARALVLCCNGSGDTGAVSFCHSWPHTSACVTGLQPFTLVSAHSHHARHWSHHGINGVDCTAPRGPTNRQYGPVRLRPAVSVRFLHITPHSASSLVLSARACFPRSATRPVFSFVLWRATCNVLDLPGTPFLPSTRFH